MCEETVFGSILSPSDNLSPILDFPPPPSHRLSLRGGNTLKAHLLAELKKPLRPFNSLFAEHMQRSTCQCVFVVCAQL